MSDCQGFGGAAADMRGSVCCCISNNRHKKSDITQKTVKYCGVQGGWNARSFRQELKEEMRHTKETALRGKTEETKKT